MSEPLGVQGLRRGRHPLWLGKMAITLAGPFVFLLALRTPRPSARPALSRTPAPPAGQRSLAIILVYGNLITAVELVGMLVGALPMLVGHTILLPVLLGHYALAAQSAHRRMLAALAIVPLLRLLSLIMPIEALPPLYWPVLIGAPLLVASVMVMRLLELSWGDVGLGRWSGLSRRSQVIVAISGAPLGAAAFMLFRLSPLLPRFNWPAAIAGALILTVFVGFAEELIFRGILQRVAGEQWGRWSLLLGGLLSAVVYLSTLSPGYGLFMAVVGLFFAWCVYRTGALWGTILAHSAMQISLFLLLPYLEIAPQTIARTTILSVAGALLTVVIVVGLLEIRFRRPAATGALLAAPRRPPRPPLQLPEPPTPIPLRVQVTDAVAGGPAILADLSRINLAQPVVDDAQVFAPELTPSAAPQPLPPTLAPTEASSREAVVGPLSLNSQPPPPTLVPTETSSREAVVGPSSLNSPPPPPTLAPTETVGPGAPFSTSAPPPPTDIPAPASASRSSARININTAAAAALETLPRLGPALARRIIKYRTTHGPFRTIEAILNVRGIGPATFEQIKALITVGRTSKSPTRVIPIARPSRSRHK